MSKKKSRSHKRYQERRKEIRWDRLDNTAHLFPVIAGEGMSNVYRVCAVLKEDIQEEALQNALDKVLPKFPVFNVRLRQGMFWYYFEENGKKSPSVSQETSWPCQYVEASRNRDYLFRVTYYKKRVNLEVFHVLTDGMGAFGFLKELVYQYLRLTVRELGEKLPDRFSSDTSLDHSDSFLEHYRKPAEKGYHRERAYHLSGPVFEKGKMGVVHGFMPVSEIKACAKRYQATMNEYLVAAFIYSIYKAKLHCRPVKDPITVCVPVNLRPHFDSVTTKNFFVVVTAAFHAKEETHTFEDIVESVKKSLRPQMTIEHLEEVFSYNVSNEKNLILRAVPLGLKKPAMRYVYRMAARANTTTVSNLGTIQVQPEYKPYIEQFYAFLSRSKGQNIKGCVCSYEGTLVFTISSVYTDSSVQRAFFCFLTQEGITVRIESNGVYDE